LFGGFEIYDRFEITRASTGKSCGWDPFENPVDIPGTSLPQSVIVRTVVQESPELGYRKGTAAEQSDFLLNRYFDHILTHVPENGGAY
jgi:hypothetical protein